MIRIPCPGCDKTLRMPDALAGRTVACPQCKTKFRAPAPETTEDVEERVSPARPQGASSRKPNKARPPAEEEKARPVKRARQPIKEQPEELDELEEIEEPITKNRGIRRTDDEADWEEPRRPARKKKKKPVESRIG